MSLMEWADLHGENGQEEKEIYKQTVEDYGFTINEFVDYRVLVEIRIFMDGSRICEVEDELLTLYNEDGDIVQDFSVTLPSKYVQEALEKAEDYE